MCLLLFLGLFTYGLPSSRGGVYLRCGHLPAVLGMFTSGGAEIVMPDGIGCIPPVVSPTLGGSKFVYTSGGSCGRACIIPPKVDRHLPAVLEVAYLRSSVLAGRCLPAVLTSTCGAFGMFTSGGAEIFMPDGMGCIPPVVSPTLGGSSLCLPPVAPADVPAIPPKIWDIYLRCY